MILLYRAGPTFNHNHADQGGFLLRAFGENLAVEAGYTDYYKDPYYASYFSQASGHNTILVDGDPASQEIADTRQFRALASYPHITDSITTASYDALGSDLSSVYHRKLKSYTRHITFLKPRYVIVYDDIVAAKPQTGFDWLLHVSDRNRLQLLPRGALYQGAKAAMRVRFFQPEGNVEIEDGHIPFALFNPDAPKAPPAEPGILDIVARAPETSFRFLILLTLGRTSQEVSTLDSTVRSLAGKGCMGIQAGNAEVLFRKDDHPFAQYGDWRTDAQAWTLAGSFISAELVTSMTKGSQIFFQSDRPVTFAAQLESGQRQFVVTSNGPAVIRFQTGFKTTTAPDEIYCDQDGTVQVRVTAGRSEFTFVRSDAANRDLK